MAIRFSRARPVILAVMAGWGFGVTGALAQDGFGLPRDPGQPALVQAPAAHPVAGALAAAILASDLPLAVQIFYAERGHAPLWLDAEGLPGAQADALFAALNEAESHGLPVAAHALDSDALSRAATDPVAAAMLELRLTRLFLSHARNLASGVLEPRRVDAQLQVRPVRPEPADLLVRLDAASSAPAMLAALAPADPDYARVRARLAQVRSLPADAWGPQVPSGATLRLGDRSDRVVTLRARLAALGDMGPEGAPEALAPGHQPDHRVAANDIVTDVALRSPDSVADPRLYDHALALGVERFQARHGLNRDGMVGPATRAALNHQPADRARQMAVTLERMRWMNRDLGRQHVMVNLAGYEMVLVADGETLFTSRVVIGKPRHQTPEFSDEMEHMVINPTWFVPSSIAHEEILPKLQEDPYYMADRNMYLAGYEGDPSVIDWRFVTPATFPGRIRQGPGDDNALGRVKFMFPNDNAIYLHDTPQKSLFARDRRAYSHGCVRVQEPYAFARALLAGQVADPQASLSRWLDSGRETYVTLDSHVPVHLTYRTAWVDAQGTDQFRDDIYGRDARIADALEKAGVGLPAR
jgi:murein L,D-transpeptidase YcbB/YkuD